MFLQKYKIIALSAIVVSFAGCEKVQPTVYEIPKENQSSTKSTPSAQEKTKPFADSAKMEILPGMREGANSLPEMKAVGYTLDRLSVRGRRRFAINRKRRWRINDETLAICAMNAKNAMGYLINYIFILEKRKKVFPILLSAILGF